MPYDPRYHISQEYEGFKASRTEQRKAYDNLAHFMYHVSTVHGVHQYSEQSIRRSLAASHILTKEGFVRQERIERWAKARGIKANLTTSDEKWANILIGDTP